MLFLQKKMEIVHMYDLNKCNTLFLSTRLISIGASTLCSPNIKETWWFPFMAIVNLIIPDLTAVAGHVILWEPASAYLSSTRVHYNRVLSPLICCAVNEQSVLLMSC